MSKDYIVEANGNGTAFFDYDNDGDMDVLIVNGSTLENYKKGGDPMVALYKNAGGTFVDVTRESGLLKRGWGMGVCAGDYNNDGYQDLYITAYGPSALFRNNGDGTFSDVTASAGAANVHWSTNCAFGDYDRDGHLDLYVANYMTFDEKSVPRRGNDPKCRFLGIDVFCGPQGLQGEPDVLFHNNGNGTFTDVTKSAGIKDPNDYGFGVVFSDFDNDGWPDIYVANDGNPNLLFHNNRNGTFSEMGVLSGAGLNEAGRAQSGMGVGIGDYDGNGLFDIFVTNFAGDTNTLYKNMGTMLFSDVTSLAGLGEVSLQYLGWGAGFEDFDNDGLPDIFVANGHIEADIEKVQKSGTKIVAPADVAKDLTGDVTPVKPGDSLDVAGVKAQAVPAYNTAEERLDYHPKSNKWVGYVLSLDGRDHYHAGDTDHVPELDGVKAAVAFVPIGGTYTMEADEAAGLVKSIGPDLTVPMHFGFVVGSPSDTEQFVKECDPVRVEIMTPTNPFERS